MENILITCFLAPLIFEILKVLLKQIIDFIRQKHMDFSMTGYWISHHCLEYDNGNKYECNELLKIRQKNDKIFAKLYQATSDGRNYTYSCFGFIRGNKIVLSYCESNNHISNSIGTINLLKNEESQHYPSFSGIYNEFMNNKQSCVSMPYEMMHIKIPLHSRLLISIFKTNYTYRYMKGENFKNALKNV